MTSAFDELASSYDQSFTASTVGGLLRAAVWRRLEDVFPSAQHVLDLGCGTGEDAVFLARRGHEVTALDASSEMVAVARRKTADAGVGERVALHRLSIEEWAAAPTALGDTVDGALSSFGALNCVADLAAVAGALAARVRPGGRVVLVVMGPWVPWEWLWYLAHGSPRKAFRRFARDGVAWRGLVVRYPSPGRLWSFFESAFRVRRLAALGALVPPSYAEGWAARHPGLVGGLARLERRFERWPPLPWLADHYVLELERRRRA